MSLKHIKAFGHDFDLCIERANQGVIISVYDHTTKTITHEVLLKEGQPVRIAF